MRHASRPEPPTSAAPASMALRRLVGLSGIRIAGSVRYAVYLHHIGIYQFARQAVGTEPGTSNPSNGTPRPEGPGRLTTGPFAACCTAALVIDLGLTAVGPRAL